METIFHRLTIDNMLKTLQNTWRKCPRFTSTDLEVASNAFHRDKGTSETVQVWAVNNSEKDAKSAQLSGNRQPTPTMAIDVELALAG